jgi:hypothetical protein
MVSTLTVIVPEEIPMEDAKVSVIYWHEKHYSATKMYMKLLACAGEAWPAYSTITNWIRALTRGEDIHGHASGAGRLPDDRVDTLVINALEESPFHSVRSLASTIKIPPTTEWRHLHARGFIVRNLHIVPHMLSLAQKAVRVESAIELKKVVCSAKHYAWRYILTGDESWFYFIIKMLTVFSSPFGFSLVQILPKGHHFNAEYFYNHTLYEIDRIRPATTEEDARRKSSSISTMRPLTLWL